MYLCISFVAIEFRYFEVKDHLTGFKTPWLIETDMYIRSKFIDVQIERGQVLY